MDFNEFYLFWNILSWLHIIHLFVFRIRGSRFNQIREYCIEFIHQHIIRYSRFTIIHKLLFAVFCITER